VTTSPTFHHWFGAWPLSSIGESEILAYLTEQLSIKARSTLQRARTTLGSVFAYAVREKVLTRNPISGVRMPAGEDRKSEGIETFTQAELAQTLKRQYEVRPYMADVTEFLSLIGIRWSELRALRVRDLQQVPNRVVACLRPNTNPLPVHRLDRAATCWRLIPTLREMVRDGPARTHH
jgi:site-specific recombinase XerD